MSAMVALCSVHCEKSERTTNLLSYGNHLTHRDLAPIDPTHDRPFALILHRSGNNLSDILHGRQADAIVVASLQEQRPPLVEVDVELEDVEVFGRRVGVGVVVGEDAGAEEGVFEFLADGKSDGDRSVGGGGGKQGLLTFWSLFRSARYRRIAALGPYHGKSSISELRCRRTSAVERRWRARECTHVAHSLGANRLTPARTHASISVLCPILSGSLMASTKESTVCELCRREVRASMSR